MNVHEYQAKEILARFGVPVPEGRVATTPEEARAAAEALGGRVVVKAQIHAGGRGKAGGVKLADGPEEAERAAAGMLGRALVTPQTGLQGRVVRKVYVTRALDIAHEYYLSLLVDRAQAKILVMASAEGGVEIEKVAAESPEKLLKLHVDPVTGYQGWLGRRLGFGLGLDARQVRAFDGMLRALVRCFEETDASLIEINPLVTTPDGSLFALDAKLNFDDNALYRHEEIAAMRDPGEEDPLEVEASEAGLNYIKLDGSVGCMVNGAGLAMATMDIIDLAGARPANFLDVGGGASKEAVAKAFRILLRDPDVRAVLVNIFGGIVRCDRVAQGIVDAAREVELTVPLVVRLQGTNAAEARKLLADSGLELEVAEALDEAARAVVAAAGGAR
ncbi:MAG: ADP-forming succinate--CoA ligase subunit beta [Acidobacteria bacterium]|nr:MAG: ADP-forming succinate--CoA ligase subunit beta [Acidobacteriota bacterium]